MTTTTGGGNNRACFSYEWLTYCYRTMLTRRCLETDFEKIVHAILFLFSEPQPAVRARVVKTLSSLTKTDPTLILRDSFRDAVTERFNDVAISVREEAVKLVGGFVLKGYDISEGPYLDGLVVRLRDKVGSFPSNLTA